ncbi:MAG TPA: hypothetical protein VGP72_17680 [Planctomycetota bacterium]|jgi:dienelactone hydrolase
MTTLAAEKPRDVNTHHCFTPPETKKEWEARAKQLREQILFSAGLTPMPEKTALNPQITSTIEGPDYFVDCIAIETWPGFYLCGNLYRPKGRKGPFPAIANPHGHFKHGRLEMEADVPRAEPPPAKPAAGKANLVSIGVNLARQGIIVFAYDMIGYNDTNQIPDHRKFCLGLQPWLWNVSLNGIQLWNSIRVVDYLCSRPDVDKERIGATGASGGGTQTFLLMAVDERIAAAAPAVMISASMQGGCMCENAPGLRVGTDNVEIGALMAPKPLLLIAATGDWTKNNPTEEWPAIKKVYDLYGKGDRTACVQFNYQHNYNIEAREAMYAFFGRWLLDDKDPEHFREKPFDLKADDMKVWTEAHPRPAGAITGEQLIKSLIENSEKQLAAAWPKDKDGLKQFRKTYATGLANALSVCTNPKRELHLSGGRVGGVLIVAVPGEKERVEKLALALRASVLWLERQSLPLTALEKDFFSCYNRTPLGNDVQRVLDEVAAREIKTVVGLGDAGTLVLLARALYDGDVRTAVDCGMFPAEDSAFLESHYAPGLRRAGDLRAAAVLCAPSPLCLINTGAKFKPEQIAETFRAVKAPLRVETGVLSTEDLSVWLASKLRP